MIVCQCNVITSRHSNFIESELRLLEKIDLENYGQLQADDTDKEWADRYPPILPPPPKAGRVARGTRDGWGVCASEVSQADYLQTT
jgi:hypothetical protein